MVLLKLYYNGNKDPNPNLFGHFFVSQLLTFLLALFVTGLMQLSNHLAVYLFYCFPIYFFLVFLEYWVFWRTQIDLTICFNIYNIVMFVVCLPIFFGVFFGIFHPTASLKFQKVQNCQLIGSLSKSIEHYENYQVLYINFEYEGEQFLGQACSSDQSEGSTTQTISPYKFLYKYDSVKCGTDGDNRRILLEDIYFKEQKIRFLASGGAGRGGGSGRSGFGGSGSEGAIDNTCSRDYKWSKVKIASWICLQRGFDLENFLENGSSAIQNGLERKEMKEEYNFPLISYSPTAYYPKDDLICLIVFTYYFWILSFNSIFQYASNHIMTKYRQYRKTIQKNTLEIIANPLSNQVKSQNLVVNNNYENNEPSQLITSNQSPNIIPIVSINYPIITDEQQQQQEQKFKFDGAILIQGNQNYQNLLNRQDQNLQFKLEI